MGLRALAVESFEDLLKTGLMLSGLDHIGQARVNKIRLGVEMLMGRRGEMSGVYSAADPFCRLAAVHIVQY